MSNQRCTFIALALVALVASALACNPPDQMGPRSAPGTVTPYVPVTSQPTAPPGAEATELPPSATEIVPSPTATEAPLPTATPTSIPPTPVPALKPTVAPLDFAPPQYVDSWEKKGTTNKVVLKVEIVGGVPPFTVSHGPTVQGTTMNRVFYIEFEWASCKSAIVQSITVESSDGQKVKKDYFIPVANMPWCAP